MVFIRKEDAEDREGEAYGAGFEAGFSLALDKVRTLIEQVHPDDWTPETLLEELDRLDP